MDDTPTPPARSARRPARDNFLADAVRTRTRHLSYGDGFRLGIGFMTANLLIILVTAALAWLFIVVFKLHL